MCQSWTKRISSFESEQVILDSKSSTEQTKLGFEVLLRVLVVSFWGHTKKFAHFKKLIFSRTKNPDACTYLSEPDHIYQINCPDYWFCYFIVRLLNAKVYCRNYTANKSNFYTRFVIIPDIWKYTNFFKEFFKLIKQEGWKFPTMSSTQSSWFFRIWMWIAVGNIGFPLRERDGFGGTLIKILIEVVLKCRNNKVRISSFLCYFYFTSSVLSTIVDLSQNILQVYQ